MAEFFGSRLANRPACREAVSRLRSAGLLLALASILIFQGVSASAQSAASSQAKKGPQTGAKTAASAPVPVAPPPAPILLPPTQTPSHPPVIAWDGQLLTIDADNSSLSDILLGIRSRTGASIEMPPSTSSERIAVHIGPAPIREVISSLLYGTDFNYVIEASDNDESGLGKVILSSRNDRDAGSGDMMAGEPDRDPNIRLMPGYSAPGKTDFEVAHSNASGDPSSVGESPSSADSTPANQDSTPVAAAVDSASPAATDSQPATTTADSTDSSAPADTSLAAAGSVSGNTASGMSGIGSAVDSVGGTQSISQMEQNLQKMYQQRQQLQAKQGHGTNQTPAP